MIIDAMDLLYAERFDGFCIVSSDSDFTRLASRIREAGLIVYGFGERKTPLPFVSACDKFIYTDRLVGTVESEPEEPKAKKSPAELRGDTKLMNLLRNAIDAASDENGWAALSTVGGIVNKRSPDFDSWLVIDQPDGPFRKWDDDSGGGKDAKLAVTLPATGRYIIAANAVAKRSTGRYTLRIDKGN